MILSVRGNFSEVNNLAFMLPILRAYLFRFNVQDRSRANPSKSRTTSVAPCISWCVVVIYSAAENNVSIKEVQETVTFRDDAAPEKKDLPVFVDIDSGLKSSAVSQRQHDITDFLSRPIICANGSWSVTDASNAVLHSMAMPQGCFDNSPMIVEKLRGFYGFRAKMRIRVQLNCQRFQQGRLLLHWIPSTDLLSPVRVQTANYHLTLKTQQPRIDIDASDTDVEFEVPYVNPNLYYNLISKTGGFGTFYLSVYSPLVSSSSTNADYTIWCQFTDVQVLYPTAAVLTAQAGYVKRRRGTTGTQAITEKELDSQGAGPISGFLTKFSTAAGIMGEIPLISSIATPASWVASVLSRSASAMGFSKPTMEDRVCAMKQQPMHGMINSDVIDNSLKLSLSVTNKIDHLPGFAGSDIDEMSLSYINQIPAFREAKTWSTSNMEGTAIWESPVSMSVYTGQDIAAGPGVSYWVNFPAPYAYNAAVFRRWRGSMTYTFKFVKTEFHSGRLVFVFFPGDNILDSACTLASSEYCYREVLDLRTSNEFSVNVPYVNLQPWTDYNNKTGFVKLFVLNELRAPDTVSQSIEVLVEVAGGHDLEFSWPSSSYFQPLLLSSGAGVQSLMIEENDVTKQEDLVTQEEKIEWRAEAGYGKNVSQEEGALSSIATADAIDNTNNRDGGIDATRLCVGEKVLSIRQLMKRFSTKQVTVGSTNKYMVFGDPFGTQIMILNIASGVTKNANTYVDMIDYFSSMYVYNRGSIRIKMQPVNQSMTLNRMVYAFLTPNTFGGATLNAFSYLAANTNNLIGGYSNTDAFAPTAYCFNGVIEVEVPAYQPTHSRVQRYLQAEGGEDAPIGFKNEVALVLANDQVAQTPARVSRAAGDDYNCGFFIGVLPCITYTVAPTNQYNQ